MLWNTNKPKEIYHSFIKKYHFGMPPFSNFVSVPVLKVCFIFCSSSSRTSQNCHHNNAGMNDLRVQCIPPPLPPWSYPDPCGTNQSYFAPSSLPAPSPSCHPLPVPLTPENHACLGLFFSYVVASSRKTFLLSGPFCSTEPSLNCHLKSSLFASASDQC